MGKKKKGIQKNTHSKSGNNVSLYLTGIAIVFVGMIGFMAFKSKAKESVNSATAYSKSNNQASSNLTLKETRPLLPASMWTGSIAEAYRIAAKIPEVIDAQYCNCDCSINERFKHKTLLTCFTDDHGANCGICMNEVFYSNELHQKGLSIKEITKEVDRKFSKYSRGHRGT